MLDKKIISIIENFTYWEWEYYMLYKYRNNPYLSVIDMDHENHYTPVNFIEMYDSIPKNMDEFILENKKKESYFFLGLSFDCCELIEMRHKIYPHLKEQNYNKMAHLIKSNQDNSSVIRNLAFAMADYFFHFHIKNNSIFQEDDDFFL